MAAQAQKHVTHNEAIRALDALVELAVADRDLPDPPASPADGHRYIVASGATGAWSGKDDQIAAWQDGAWMFFAPREGWTVWVSDEDRILSFDGSAWSSAASETAAQFGINTTADAANRLSVKSDATLFSHDDVTPGSGDMLIKINKSGAGKTASFVFQDNYSGRAEIGLAGDDDLHFKVSPDGTTFNEAILIDNAAGSVSFPRTADIGYNRLINGDFSINQRAFAGGALAAGDYGFDRWKADTGAANMSVSGDTVTLTSGTIVQIIENPGLASASVTLSVEDLTSGDLDIDIEGQTATIAAGAGRKGATVNVPPGSTGDITVKLTPDSAAVSFKRVKLERGTAHSGWSYRHTGTELALCQRYHYRRSSADYAYQTYGVGVVDLTTRGRVIVDYPVRMRATPTMAFSGNFRLFSDTAYTAFSTMTASLSSDRAKVFASVTTATLTVGYAVHLSSNNDTGAYIEFDAEL